MHANSSSSSCSSSSSSSWQLDMLCVCVSVCVSVLNLSSSQTIFLNTSLFHIWEFHQILLIFYSFQWCSLTGCWSCLRRPKQKYYDRDEYRKNSVCGFLTSAYTRCVRMMNSPAWAPSRYSTKRWKLCHTQRKREGEREDVDVKRGKIPGFLHSVWTWFKMHCQGSWTEYMVQFIMQRNLL